MKLSHIFFAAVLSVASAADGLAIDRGADSIESVNVTLASYEDLEETGIFINSETAVPTVGENIGFLLALGYDVVSEDGVSDDGHCWLVEMGLKFYMSDLLSVQFTGEHREYDLPNNRKTDMNAFSADTRLRFYSAFGAISPYVSGGAKIQFGDQPITTENFSALVVEANVGCDFLMKQDMAINIEGGYCESENLSGDPEFADGWLVNIGMKYYWE
ncbi:MAG: hypothetical protein R6V03_05135 [Kiritimatiellia bacterium]